VTPTPPSSPASISSLATSATLVIPVPHFAHIYEINHEIAAPLMTTLSRVATAVKSAFSADGISIRQNNEPHGGQDVFHVHFHVIPRFADDGFATGKDHFPFGTIEVPLEQRIRQAKQLAESLSQLDSNAAG
jgi:histidine triad (HIT) family protein